jgi:hypothetical protein
MISRSVLSLNDNIIQVFPHYEQYAIIENTDVQNIAHLNGVHDLGEMLVVININSHILYIFQ